MKKLREEDEEEVGGCVLECSLALHTGDTPPGGPDFGRYNFDISTESEERSGEERELERNAAERRVIKVVNLGQPLTLLPREPDHCPWLSRCSEVASELPQLGDYEDVLNQMVLIGHNSLRQQLPTFVEYQRRQQISVDLSCRIH
jgi:hypothetical protein